MHLGLHVAPFGRVHSHAQRHHVENLVVVWDAQKRTNVLIGHAGMPAPPAHVYPAGAYAHMLCRQQDVR